MKIPSKLVYGWFVAYVVFGAWACTKEEVFDRVNKEKRECVATCHSFGADRWVFDTYREACTCMGPVTP